MTIGLHNKNQGKKEVKLDDGSAENPIVFEMKKINLITSMNTNELEARRG
jgi:hypothetical protein